MHNKPIKNYCNKYVFVVAFALLILAVCLLVIQPFDKPEKNPTVPNQLSISANDFIPANHKQFDASIKLAASGGKLYMWNATSSAFYWLNTDKAVLSCYEDGAFQKIRTLDGRYVGVYGDALYYYCFEDQQCQVRGCDLNTGEQIHFTAADVICNKDVYFTDDGMLHFPENRKRTTYHTISGMQYIEQNAGYETYEIHGRSYMLCGDAEEQYLISRDANGAIRSYETEIPYGDKVMIPCENGLLIHNMGYGKLLYYVEGATGKVVTLFTADCLLSHSAVNAHGGYVYLSCALYTESGEWGGVEQGEGDELSGTYRISLVDYSVEKISDAIYNGLYIFDDTGIYACNQDKQVFKLDFDGKVFYRLV